MLPKISIVTVNLNNARFLEKTIQSVLNQGYPNLEYIIIDGGSSDGSVEIIRKYQSRLAYWKSEKDEGYGFALQKGFNKSTGEIMAWLNSDDIYLPNSLFTVAEMFNASPQVKWITGFPSWCNEKGFHLGEMPITEQSEPYWVKRYDLYRKYSRWSRIRYLGGDFLAIQQESTFWKRDLWEKAGGQINTNYKLAADTELWCRFFRHEKLYSVNSIFAAFRLGSEKQLTKNRREEYLKECLKAIEAERNLLGFVDLSEHMIQFFLSKLFKPCYYFDLPMGFFYEKLLQLPKEIHFNKKEQQHNQAFVILSFSAL